MKRVDSTKTLAYAVAFHFGEQGGIYFSFRNSSKVYTHVKTVYTPSMDGNGYANLQIAMDLKTMKYVVFDMDVEGKKEITIL